MTNDQLKDKADELFALFHPMPNSEKREKLFSEWMKFRREESLRIYKSSAD